jgi:hypothetical protein
LKLWESAVIVLLAVPLFAQDQDKKDQDKKDQIQDATTPTPVLKATPELIPPTKVVGPEAEKDAVAQPPEPEYSGPAILSRGGMASVRIPTESLRIQPFLTVMGNYDTGITPVTVSPQGQIPNDNSIGVDVSAGLYGYYRWKTATLGVDYQGTYRDYARNTSYNGTDQSLSLLFQKQATRHVGFTLRESAGLFARNFYSPGAFNLIDPSFSNTPTNDIFDGRTIYLNTMADLTYQKSARLSFNFGGDGFVTRRRSSSLYGVTGYRARGDIAYRTTRYATTGVAYDFTHFEYTKGFGGSDVHTLAIVQSFRIGKRWELSVRGGGSRVETLGIGIVNIDPVIAAIIGRSQGIEAIYRVNWAPTLDGRLTRSFHHASLSFGYSRGVTPGNGLYLTSRGQTGTASFSYTGIRKLNVGVSLGYNSYGSLTQTVGNYSGYTGGAGFTYTLTRALHFITRYDYRRYDIAQSVFRRDSYRASIGFGFSPKDVPLTLW